MNHVQQQDYFPLSLSQKNIWNLETSLAGTPANNISATIRIEGRIDPVLLQSSIQQVLRADSSLRTRIVITEDGNPQQYHADYQDEEFPLYDLSYTSSENFDSWEQAMVREMIPVTDGPLYRFFCFRLGENSGGVLVKTHHIISDGYSQILLCNRITRNYLNLLAEKMPEQELMTDYRLHVEEEQEYLTSKAYLRDQQYWKTMLEQSGEPSVLKSVSSAAVSPVGCRYSVKLPQILNHEISTFCQKKRIAPFSVYYMAMAIYFKRIGGADRFTVGVPIINRTNYAFKRCTGMFVTTLPFFNTIDAEWSFNQFNEALIDNWLELLRHQRYPYSHIESLHNSIRGEEGRLFHIMLSYQDGQAAESTEASVNVSGRWHYSGYQAEQLCIHMTNLFDNKQYSIDYDYLVQFFAEEEIIRFHEMICTIMHAALSEPDKPICELPIISMEEKERVLYTFNRTDRPLRAETAFQQIQLQAETFPQRVAVIDRGQRYTYQYLMEMAARVAAGQIAKAGTTPALAAILLPRSFSLLACMAGTMKAGNAFLLLPLDLPEGRRRTIVEQSGAKILLTDRHLFQKFHLDELKRPVILYEDIEAEEYRDITVSVKENDLAYVVYTSGSTGTPKGVEITQKSLVNLAQAMEPVYGKGAVLSMCSTGFDAYLLESASALMCGKTIITATAEEQESPKAAAALITGYAAGFLSISPSRLTAMLKNPEFRKAVSRLETVLCGGEPFPANLLKELKKLTPARIYNQYGPSETTVAVSMKELSHAERITAGGPMDNCRLYVLDQGMNPLPAGIYGKLFVGGCCVGKGYRGQEDLTAKSYFDSPFENGERIYDTGDIACWTEDGEILLAGRMDRQIKIRGQRIELDEIAACIASYPGIIQAAAKVWMVCGEPLIVAYYTGEKSKEADLLSFAATYLPRYMIPVKTVHLDRMPINVNGKIEEANLPEPQWSGEQYNQAEGGETANLILGVFRKVLEKSEMGLGDDYFTFGGNSLNAMETLTRLEELTGIRVRVADLYACRSAARLAGLLDKEIDAEELPTERQKAIFTVQKSPQQERWPLSAMQQGIYVQSYLDVDGRAYNMPGAFRLSCRIERHRLESAFHDLIAGDRLLQTCFCQKQDGVYMYIDDRAFDFMLETVNGKTVGQAMKNFVRPFDLSKAPLLRAGLWKDENNRDVLLLDSHHIIGDGLSTAVLLRRLNDLYCGRSVSAALDYMDYLWSKEQFERRQDQKEKEELLQDWLDYLYPLPEPLELPCDFSRPHDFDFAGGEEDVYLDRELSLRCDEFCREQGITPYVLFLGVFSLLLARLTGKSDFLLGMPLAGRKGDATAQICGPFINTLPVRIRYAANTVSEYLKELQDRVNAVLDWQDISLENLISALELPRGEKNALYQVMFSQSPVDESVFVLGDMPMEYVPVAADTVKMDLTCELRRMEGRYSFHIGYARSLFLPETIDFYGRCLQQIVKEFLRNLKQNPKQVQLLAPVDFQKYVAEPNYAATPFINLPVQHFIKQQALIGPEETAIVFHGETVTRFQLDRRSDEIARLLSAAGAEAGMCIGVICKRSPDLIAAMLAILKLGCAYVPMLPTYPQARLSYMMETAGVDVSFCDQASKGLLPEDLPCRLVTAEVGTSTNAINEDNFSAVNVSGEDLVNVMFTSGSTGRPKGVMLKHRAVSSLFVSIRELLERAAGPILCTTNVVFDSFIGESLFPLAMGKEIIMADEEEMMLPWKLAELIDTYKVEIFQVTPARLQMCLGNEAFCRGAARLKLVLLGGEVLTPQLLQSLHQVTDAISVNMYGPTEATVYMTMIDVKPGDHITIGRPLHNNRIYVLDEERRPVMPTACGELYMAGECLARGYISRDDLTEAAFISDVYFPGERMYKSGDIGRLRLDGSYDFLGRSDAQVKLNGQRVELDEITGLILESGGARQAATIAVRKDEGAMELWSFYEPEGRQSAAEERILDFLKQKLPAYMIPSRVVAMGRIPLTPSSKIDLQQLKKQAMEMVALHTEFQAECVMTEILPERVVAELESLHEDDTEMTPSSEEGVDFVLHLWKQVLTRTELDADISFFEQGGTSLDALTVLSGYFNHNRELSLAQFYQHPTAREQAALLGFSASSENETAENSRMILVTGGTGFLGAHLIKELLDKGKHIICLTRGGLKRQQEALDWYFGQGYTENHQKSLEVFDGDFTKSGLGLCDEYYGYLKKQVGQIYHSGADVRHYASDRTDFMRTNVEGTENLLTLAWEADAAFYHMSTCSVSGNRLRQDADREVVYTEEDFDIGQIWENNVYVKSKFLAEKSVREAFDKGLAGKIFRLGRLVGRSDDGVFQRNPETNAFWLLMRSFASVGAVPERIVNIQTDITPVDFAAKAILNLCEAEGRTYHIMHPNPPTVGEITASLGVKLEQLNDEAFSARLFSAVSNGKAEGAAAAVDYWYQLRYDAPRIRVTCEKTLEAMQRMEFVFAIPSPEIILKDFIKGEM
ncbi:amino acid adenylation domain-containing protein [Ihubacter sp. rT4E-8]|uniref:non-ribosomal peptide synthetase n=1 Tax=Ihubacter sp. rT4E-8 TaxID=3242369 RepID=UPI003CFB7F6D